MNPIKDRTGIRMGRLTFVEYVDTRKDRARWLVRCDCGNEKVVIAANVVAGRTQSCGCIRQEFARIKKG